MTESSIPAAPSPAYYDFTEKLLEHFPLTEVSLALHARVEPIILAWTAEIRRCIPAASNLPFTEITDGLPAILPALANALGSTDPEVRHQLLLRSPTQGISRFQQHYQPRDLLFEDRLLRAHVVEQVSDELGRMMTMTEHVSLCMGMDLMSQQANVAYIEHQASQLRTSAEVELRFLSFLSHDLGNNLHTVTLWLQVLKTQLAPGPALQEQLDSIDTIQQAVLTTMGGMGRLMQAERLRQGAQPVTRQSVDLLSAVTNQTRFASERAYARNLKLVVDVPKNAKVVTDADLLALVLQNLLGNAVKFASPGTVIVRAEIVNGGGRSPRWAIRVIDEGPGIPPEHVESIFGAFQRGTMQGESGVGLGLAIASRAASLLGGALTVDSEVGGGSTFTLTLPATPEDVAR